MSENVFIVAVDGGAASGKSSTSKGVSASLNLMHVDTGAHYRTLTYFILENGVEAEDVEGVKKVLSSLTVDSQMVGKSAFLSVAGRVLEDSEIRNERIDNSVSPVAAIPEVRAFLLDYQRGQAEFAAQNGFKGLIMEGRDIGSAIFPDADLRLFFFADPETRMRRRAAEGRADEILRRDKMDSSRKAAPMKCPEGAIKMDTGAHTLKEVIEIVSDRVQKEMDSKKS